MIHFLTGENTYEVDQRLKKLTAAFVGDVERYDGSELTLEQLPDLFMGATLFSDARLIVIKNVSDNKPVWNVLAEWLEKGSANDLVLVEKAPDKRTKTYKWLEKHATMTQNKELPAHEASVWVSGEAKRRGMELPRGVAQFLVDYVGADQWRLQAEVEKLALAGKPLSNELIRDVVEPTPQATVFELLDTAFGRRHEQFEKIFSQVSRSEDPYMFFGLLAGQIYALAVAAYADVPLDQAAKQTGVHPFVLRKLAPLARSRSKTELADLVERLAELDANLKSRAVEPWVQIRSFLTTLS